MDEGSEENGMVEAIAGCVIRRCGGVEAAVVWWCGGVVVRWCGGVVVWRDMVVWRCDVVAVVRVAAAVAVAAAAVVVAAVRFLWWRCASGGWSVPSTDPCWFRTCWKKPECARSTGLRSIATSFVVGKQALVIAGTSG